MRIATGEFKGRILKMPKSKLVRPTREMVRKAIFDVLGDFIAGKEVLDLFSGSGALGFEALSCGAKCVTFVEKMFACQKVIRENMLMLKLEPRCRIIGRDAFSVLPELAKQNMSCKVIFADPPYAGELAKKCLLEISNCDIIRPPEMVIIEHCKDDELPDSCNILTRWQLKKYGDTFVSFYTPD